MWPWEHLAVAYLVYSPLVRARTGDPPRGAPALWLVAGTQFPDLVDKPLAWSLGVIPSGTSVAHSVFVAVPLVALAVALARRLGRGELGVAFGLGYLTHLPADAVYPAVIGGSVAPGVFLWPLVGAGGSTGPPAGLVSETVDLLVTLAENLAGPAGLVYLVIEVVVVGGALALWLVDGRPGIETGRALLRLDR